MRFAVNLLNYFILPSFSFLFSEFHDRFLWLAFCKKEWTFMRAFDILTVFHPYIEIEIPSRLLIFDERNFSILPVALHISSIHRQTDCSWVIFFFHLILDYSHNSRHIKLILPYSYLLIPYQRFYYDAIYKKNTMKWH